MPQEARMPRWKMARDLLLPSLLLVLRGPPESVVHLDRAIILEGLALRDHRTWIVILLVSVRAHTMVRPDRYPTIRLQELLVIQQSRLLMILLRLRLRNAFLLRFATRKLVLDMLQETVYGALELHKICVELVLAIDGDGIFEALHALIDLRGPSLHVVKLYSRPLQPLPAKCMLLQRLIQRALTLFDLLVYRSWTTVSIEGHTISLSLEVLVLIPERLQLRFRPFTAFFNCSCSTSRLRNLWTMSITSLRPVTSRIFWKPSSVTWDFSTCSKI